MDEKIKEGFENLKIAQRSLYMKILDVFPEDTIVTWLHRGRHPQEGRVIGHSESRYDAVQVFNTKTNREMWVDVRRLNRG